MTSGAASSFLALFPFWCLNVKGEKRVIFIYIVFHSSLWSCGMCDGCIMDKETFYMWLVKL
jgi:hypothetical protein